MRLDKFLSKATDLSRKEAKKLLHRGEILVDGTPIKDPSTHINPAQEVSHLGQVLRVARGPRYLLLHKPQGFECSLKPKEYPSVTELIAIPQVEDLRIAGRLDVDTTGALLLSDDGAFIHAVTSPKKKQPKVYHLTLADAMDERAQTDAITAVARGILLEGDTEKTHPAHLEFVNATHATLVLTQGKYHQVKRMMGYFGNRVIALHRSQIGALTLEGLEAGECRHLTADEIAHLSDQHCI